LIIRALFEVIEKVKSEEMLIQFCLAHLDGILEDSRERISIFNDIENHFKTPKGLISIMNSFIHRNNSEDKLQRDIASHILALMIEAEKYERCEKEAKEFLLYLTLEKDIQSMKLSHQAYTFAVMTLLKTNELAKIFCADKTSFKIISDYLEGPCLSQP
jgi:hypothetical protein